jgi:hypothetical protein
MSECMGSQNTGFWGPPQAIWMIGSKDVDMDPAEIYLAGALLIRSAQIFGGWAAIEHGFA